MAPKGKRLKPIRLPISADDALRGALQVPPEDDAKPKKRKTKKKRKK